MGGLDLWSLSASLYGSLASPGEPRHSRLLDTKLMAMAEWHGVDNLSFP